MCSTPLAGPAAAWRAMAATVRGRPAAPRGAAVIEELEALLDLQEAVAGAVHDRLAVADADGAPAIDGAVSTAMWLARRARMHPARARRVVRESRRLYTDAARPLPAAAAAWRAGQISTGQVEAIVSATATAPTEVVPLLEAAMIAHAGDIGPAELARAAHTTVMRLREQAGDLPTTAEVAEARCFDLVATLDGWVRVDGFLEPDAGGWLKAVVDTLAAPVATTLADGSTTPDPRSATQRRADAVAEMARIMAAAGPMPSLGGARPVLQVLVEAGDLDRLATPSTAPAGTTPDGSPVPAAVVAELLCDADVDLALVDSHVVAADGLGFGALVARLAVGLGGWRRDVLDLGRGSRCATPRQRRALEIRDGGCAAPGCRVPARWCQVHHVVAWREGGPTDLDNMVLLCGAHHRFLHRHGWILRHARDGSVTLEPPGATTTRRGRPPPSAA